MSKLVLGVDYSQRLFTIDANSIRHHTLVVGQSGSGKSTFLTRLVEEAALRTGARVLILDPNGDYSRIHRVDSSQFDESLTSVHTAAEKAGLRAFDSYEAFLERWENINIQYVGFSRWDEDSQASLRRRRASIYVAWCDMNRDDRSALIDIDAATSPQLYSAFTALDDYLYAITKEGKPDVCDIGCDPLQHGVPYDLTSIEAATSRLTEANVAAREPSFRGIESETWRHVAAKAHQLRKSFNVWEPRIGQGVTNSLSLPPVEYIVENGVLGRARSWSVCVVGMVQQKGTSVVRTQDDALLTVDAVLSRVWECALSNWRELAPERTPVFIVLDEAQLFAPQEANSALQQRVTGKLIRIAAEGRKYGLHLILSTQRPSKLHDGIIYECENQAILRLQSPSELTLATSAFGLADSNIVSGFVRAGQCVLRGRWVDGSQAEFRCSKSRITSGGEDLDSDYWIDEASFGSHESRLPLFSATPDGGEAVSGSSVRRSFSDMSSEELYEIAATSTDVEYLLHLAKHRAKYEDWGVARNAAERVLEFEKDDPVAQQILARALHYEGLKCHDAGNDVALDVIRRRFEVIAQDDSSLKVREQRAHFEKACFGADVALPQYKALVADSSELGKPQQARALRQLAVCLRETGQKGESDKVLMKALTIQPGEHNCLLYQAEWLAECGEVDAALNAAVALRPRLRHASQIQRLATLFERLGEQSEADDIRSGLSL